MSFPVFKDFDKNASDLLKDDFEDKVSLKIKTSAPYKSTVTSTTEFDSNTNTLVPKLSVKFPWENFTLEKLEFDSKTQMKVETSMTDLVSGLKLEFKGDDKGKSDISFKYSAPFATFTGELDMFGLKSANGSVCGGQGPFVAGANANLALENSSVKSTTFNLGAGYTIPNSLFAGVRANNNLSSYSALVTYSDIKDVTLVGKVDYSNGKLGATVGSVYKCNPHTTLKLKGNSTGVLSASAKHACGKNFSITGSAEVPSDFNNFKFGMNITLG